MHETRKPAKSSRSHVAKDIEGTSPARALHCLPIDVTANTLPYSGPEHQSALQRKAIHDTPDRTR